MEPEAVTNGERAHEPSAAERLLQQHMAQEAHQPQVEEVEDVDLKKTPAAVGDVSLPVSTDPSRKPTPAPSDKAPMSAVAAGKQPVREDAAPAPATAPKPKKPALNTQDEEAFPALGAPKTTNNITSSRAWASKPAAVGAPANQISLPGRSVEQYQIPRACLIPREQLKKPLAAILQDVNKRSKAHVDFKDGPANNVTLVGRGPQADVRAAFKEAASQLCGRQKVQLPIPASLRGRVVGRQGATIQAISKKTGAQINISAQKAAEILEDDDLNNLVDVTIEGNVFAVEQAKQDIEAIVGQHTAMANSKLRHIPPEYYPFLAARQHAMQQALQQQQQQQQQQERELKMQIPQYHTWSHKAPPAAPANFEPRPDLPIHLSGDMESVIKAKAEIERAVAELQRDLTLSQVAMDRGRHQFILGDMGTTLDRFLADTGCSIILPPRGTDSEEITVVGPPDRLPEATERVLELASAINEGRADIAKQHPNAPRGGQAHARDVTRYLQQRNALKAIEQARNVRIFPQEDGNMIIYGRNNMDIMKARQDVVNLASAHPPSRFQRVDVDPFYCAHLRNQAAADVRSQHGVKVLVPADGENQPVLLVFEDRVPSPDYTLPQGAPQNVAAYQQALEAARKQILDLVSGRQPIVSQDVEAPVKFHDKIRKYVDRHHSAVPDQLPVQVDYNAKPRAQGQTTPCVQLRGPQDLVDLLNSSLQAFIEQEKKDELERGFTLSFDFPQKYANHLIGRRGENINRLREEYDVDIQLRDGKCEVKGPEAKATRCKKHIQDMVKKLEDEVTHYLNIPAQFHRELIGAKGDQVRRLQDRYGVRVEFPRPKQADDDHEEESTRRQQAPNEVIVKGPSRGADSCRDELLSLLQWVKDNSYTATVSVAQEQLPSLIGSGGKEMDALRLDTGAQIDVPNARDAACSDGRIEIKIRGTKQAVDAAKKAVEEKSKVFDNSVVRNKEVDRKYHRHIIGPQGANLRRIISEAGGPDDTRSHSRIVRFPKSDDKGNTIRVEGPKSLVDAICAAIDATVTEQESQTTVIVEVNPSKHRILIGHGGESRRQLERQFGVSLQIPRQDETGPARSQVRITGQPKDVEQAKTHILELTKEQQGETVAVPRSLHHAVADNGQFFRRLRNQHRVSVGHAGEQPPPKPSAPRRPTGGALPLITDAADADHSWEPHELHASDEGGDIPWVLAGPSAEAVQAARDMLQKAILDAQAEDMRGYLVLSDPRAHRRIVGAGGSEINRIRQQTGTKIQVPRAQNKGEPIEIVGPKAGVEEARDMMLEIMRQAL
ncbi:RNA-binding G protein effector of mating response pathway [Piedraia hortae CBS 480.64]|uniref:RNA-binding G protein effector of mating response pathway n=1 Tax=Piedraia hortae CBS 480.64 TaxID=1314780 RepID=A0A6A7BZP0_9PEZI|nr:RNA-binding G protein effector of mating response pathway [Piedraia hortae CBS 480.64]